jgi:DNA invertase Pin-like site-specific DNA recombinase
MIFVFIYCRISADQHGRAEGVQAQEKWGREYAAQRWPGVPIKVFADNDLSAAKDDVYRPEFEQMREAIRRGECAHLWAVEQNRLTRREVEWFGLAAELARAGVAEVHTKRNGVIDVDGVFAGINAVLGAHEVKQLRKRLIDKKGELAAQGRPGGRLGYGYRQVIYTPEEEVRLREWRERRHQATIRGQDMRQWKADNPRPMGGRPVLDEQGRKSAEIVPEEAVIIRECAKRILNGWGLTNVAAWLNEQDLRGKHGGRFVATSVADFLTAPCVAGLRVHRGEVVGKGTWDPILDETTWRSLCAVIGARKKSRSRTVRKYLLTGYRAFCVCGKPMQSRPCDAVYAYYACEPAVTDGCGLTTIDTKALESHVAGQLFRKIEERNAARLLSEDRHAMRRAELVDELEGLDVQRAELAAMWPKKITTEQFNIMNDRLAEEAETLERELAELPAPVGRIDPDELRAAWPELHLDEQRKFVDDWISRITIRPTNRRIRSTMSVTQKDVAERAGCSQGFVSLVIQGKAKSPDLEQRVRAAIEELGYEPGPGQHRRPTTNTDRVSIDWRE